MEYVGTGLFPKQGVYNEYDNEKSKLVEVAMYGNFSFFPGYAGIGEQAKKKGYQEPANIVLQGGIPALPGPHVA